MEKKYVRQSLDGRLYNVQITTFVNLCALRVYEGNISLGIENSLHKIALKRIFNI